MIRFHKDQIFLVTGASSGIGKAVALSINELGGTVIAVARNVEKLNASRILSKNPDNLFLEVKDLSAQLDDLPIWMQEISKKYGKLSGMVLSAGIQQILPLKALSIEEAKRLFDLNYFANIALCKGFTDRRVNVGKGASIVFISSIAAIMGNVGIINYAASKGAINSAVKSLAVEVARQGIRVNVVLPGIVIGEMIEKWNEVYTKEYISELNAKYPLGVGQPQDVTGIVCFLLSSLAGWITGQSFVVDGGGSLV